MGLFEAGIPHRFYFSLTAWRQMDGWKQKIPWVVPTANLSQLLSERELKEDSASPILLLRTTMAGMIVLKYFYPFRTPTVIPIKSKSSTGGDSLSLTMPGLAGTAPTSIQASHWQKGSIIT